MRTYVRLACLAAIAMSACLIGLPAAGSLYASTDSEDSASQESGPTDPGDISAASLAEQCRLARDDFRPLGEADLRQAKQALLKSVARADRRLKQAGPAGADWRRFLQWTVMVEQLRREEPDFRVLESVLARYESGHEGLGLVWFADVRDALGHYLELAGASDHPEELKAAYRRVLDELAARLEAAGQTGRLAPEDARYVGEAVGWLDAMKQAPEVVRAIRERYARPNLLVELSAPVVAAGIAQPVDEKGPVRDVILGTNVYGTGHTTGHTEVELVPSEESGVIDTLLRGRIHTDTIGYNGPARIYTEGLTRIAARKRIRVTETGLVALPAASNAATETTIKGVGTVRGRRLGERIACKRTWEQKPLAEQVAAGRARQRVEERLDRQAAEQVARANEEYQRKLRRPLLDRGLFPQVAVFSTTTDALQLAAMRWGDAQLAAHSAPPEPPEDADLSLRLHESMVNNFAHRALGGMTVAEESVLAALESLWGKVPERFQKQEDEPPWAIGFAWDRPLWIALDDGGFRVELQGSRYDRGDESYPGMNVTAEYKFVATEQGFKAVRQAGLQIFPPGFVPDGQEKLTPRQVVIRTLLERRFGKVFEEEIPIEEFTLPGAWEKAGPMRPVAVRAEDGWLLIAWRRAAGEGVPGEAAAEADAATGDEAASDR
jgi:hypothetical protein